MANQDDLARFMTSKNGKPMAESPGEVAYGASFVEWSCASGPSRKPSTQRTTPNSGWPAISTAATSPVSSGSAKRWSTGWSLAAGADPFPSTPQRLAEIVCTVIEATARFIRSAGIKQEK